MQSHSTPHFARLEAPRPGTLLRPFPGRAASFRSWGGQVGSSQLTSKHHRPNGKARGEEPPQPHIRAGRQAHLVRENKAQKAGGNTERSHPVGYQGFALGKGGIPLFPLCRSLFISSVRTSRESVCLRRRGVQILMQTSWSAGGKRLNLIIFGTISILTCKAKDVEENSLTQLAYIWYGMPGTWDYGPGTWAINHMNSPGIACGLFSYLLVSSGLLFPLEKA
jgi:hypothetical protein